MVIELVKDVFPEGWHVLHMKIGTDLQDYSLYLYALYTKSPPLLLVFNDDPGLS